MRVVLADDHLMFRQALRALLRRHQVEVVAEAANGLAALQLTRDLLPDVVVFDLSMPSMNGLEAIRELTLTMPSIGTVLLTMHNEEAYILEAIRSGVQGYVLKSQAVDDLLDAIYQVARGSVYLSPSIADSIAHAIMTEAEVSQAQLNGRERQVLQLIAEGKSSKDVAGLLGISIKSAESHRSSLMKKIQTHDTAALVRYAVRHGFVIA